MPCCACDGIASQFDEKRAAKERRTYQKSGPRKTTRLLLAALRAEAAGAETLLDIGGGVGAIQHALVGQGYAAGTSVDAAPAYLATARAEAEAQGYADRMTYLGGDFAALAAHLAPADVVTLDRVVCCYPDAEALVRTSAEKARQAYGLVFPRRTWFTRLSFSLANALLRLRGSAFRAYLHPPDALDALLRTHHLVRHQARHTIFWHIWVYGRARDPDDGPPANSPLT